MPLLCAGPWFCQLVFQEVATPLTNMHYLGAQRGAMYSAEHNLDRFHAEAVARNRCNTPVKNLYISGKDQEIPWLCGLSSFQAAILVLFAPL